MKPTLPLHRWKPGDYVPAIRTDIRVLFERVKRERAQAAKAAAVVMGKAQ